MVIEDQGATFARPVKAQGGNCRTGCRVGDDENSSAVVGGRCVGGLVDDGDHDVEACRRGGADPLASHGNSAEVVPVRG